VVDLHSSLAGQLCAEGSLEPGLENANFIDGETTDCGVREVVTGKAIVYDKNKFPTGPKTIADSFNSETFPGKRGLQRQPVENLKWLIADGVPLTDVYMVFGTSEEGATAPQVARHDRRTSCCIRMPHRRRSILADDQVVTASAYSHPFADAIKNSGKHFQIVWDT